MTQREKFVHETVLAMMENSEYNGRKRTPSEEWELYKMLKPIAERMADEMQWEENPVRREEVETIERNEAAAIARVEEIENRVVATYNLEWLNEPIECSKYDTLDQFLHAFNADKQTVRLLRRGVWLVPNKQYCARRGRTRIPEGEEIFLDSFIEKLLKARVIERAKRNGYSAKLKIIKKSDNNPRMIIDYSHLKSILKSPPVFLPGILYILKYHPELFQDYATKIDIKNMFYNAPIIPACRDVTTFEYKKKYYRCSRLPFGIQPAPFFAMKLMKVVLDWIRSKGIACWCHMDDILLTGNKRLSGEYNTTSRRTPETRGLENIARKISLETRWENRIPWGIYQQRRHSPNTKDDNDEK